MVTILMMSAKMAIPGLCKIKVFWKKGYDVTTSVNDVTNKTLSCVSYYIVDVVMGTTIVFYERIIINSSL